MPNLNIDNTIAQPIELNEKALEFTLQRKVGVGALDVRFGLRSQFDLLHSLGCLLVVGSAIVNRHLFDTAEPQFLNSLYELEFGRVQ
jgi:hypothetical protein